MQHSELLALVNATPAPRGRETNPVLTSARRALSTMLDVHHGLMAGWHGASYRWDCPPGNDLCPRRRELDELHREGLGLYRPEWPESKKEAWRAANAASSRQHMLEHRHVDEDGPKVAEALEASILSLAPYRRTGRPRKGDPK
jgi:hypothetical protein